ncbi:MAG: chemotaxis protein CheB [Geobacteraceae bacterium GWC2_58_44]|nr:MAG: chemotaxis protein CheB [Geobacteraceae bacterium GWC2_58_44]
MRKLRQASPSAESTGISPAGAARHRENIPFPIVGLGASAGGLEALEQFLRQVPAGCGMAFVIIQHLDPTHKGIMAELLQRITQMQVLQVRDRMEVKPDCVYVIPPNKDMSILRGVLHLFEPSAPRGLRLPIDFFLRSLAEDRHELAIGVILSGMGSDGTLGVRAIREKGGLVLAQEPASAKFDSMPRSVIDAGLADLVAPVEELPARLIDSLRQGFGSGNTAFPLEEKDQGALEKVVILLRAKTGHDFSLYKKNTIYRRLERRMGLHQINRIAGYVRYLQDNPQEAELLFKELLIGVTSFFRDPACWEQLQQQAIPALLASRPKGGALRAWSTGCSTGEEAYSLAIAFKEALEQAPGHNFTVQIFATDLDGDAIDQARQGLYPVGIAADLTPERLRRFFVREERGYRVVKEIREMVTFAVQNVIMDPPFTRLDLLICRNLLIYLTPELQKKLLPLFHYSLNPGGVLFLGSAETVSAFGHLFEPLNLKTRLFRCIQSVLPAEPIAFPPSFVPALPGFPKEPTMLKPEANLQSLADQLLLQQFSPPAVLTNDKGDILYISGRTGRYLEPAAGKANWNIFAMAREGLRFELGNAFHKAVRQQEAVTVRGLKPGGGDPAPAVDITLQAVEKPEALRGMVMIVFSEVAAQPEKRAPRGSKSATGSVRVFELEQELSRMREALQSTREQMQSSQEELKSANEELQSTNEELQSTNEELTTSREEMQSLNEELQTVNAEQQSKMEELSRVNNDMRNLLNSTEIVTVFLDRELHVRRFTSGADKIFKLIPTDMGRPLSDVACELSYPEMYAETQEVLRTLVFSEKQVSTRDGRWYLVRIMPYRTMEDVIGGVVMTFTNISAAKALEAELRAENAQLKSLLEEKG